MTCLALAICAPFAAAEDKKKAGAGGITVMTQKQLDAWIYNRNTIFTVMACRLNHGDPGHVVTVETTGNGAVVSREIPVFDTPADYCENLPAGTTVHVIHGKEDDRIVPIARKAKHP